MDAPPPDTVEGLLYALPQDPCLVDARRLATALGDTPPAPRASPWFGYAPLDPAHLATGEVSLNIIRSNIRSSRAVGY